MFSMLIESYYSWLNLNKREMLCNVFCICNLQICEFKYASKIVFKTNVYSEQMRGFFFLLFPNNIVILLIKISIMFGIISRGGLNPENNICWLYTIS